MAFPYYPAHQPQMYQNQYNPQQNSGLIWVQGIEAAKSYPVSAGQSVLLMDSESNAFFIKTADASGMPLPLRVFDYTERAANNVPKAAQETHTEPTVDLSDYLTRQEFEARIAKICAEYEHKDNHYQNYKKGGQDNGK